MNKKGSIMLIVIIFMLVASIVIAAAITMLLSTSTSTTKVEDGQMAYQSAESGGEEAVLQLLRDPSFQGTETNIPAGQANFDITVSASWPKQIDSYGKFGVFTRHL
ncbi:hypothetical protein HY024_02075, partial [Candidatus Curtissbacteria bacterium]|nr:hypothetical protein [Candidatus Curtissbacteria bacterium]